MYAIRSYYDQGERYDFSKPFQRMTVREAVQRSNPDIDADALSDSASARKIAAQLDIPVKDKDGPGKVEVEIFEKTVEPHLKDPTFITAFPVEA